MTMKKNLLLYMVFLGLCLPALSSPVDLSTAKTVASKFMRAKEVWLSTTYHTTKGTAAFYVFNTTDGYVIVAADDCVTPIIGYSHEGCFQPKDVPIQLEAYLQDYSFMMQHDIENHIVADETITSQWASVKFNGKLNDSSRSKSVAPLLKDKWHQGCLYNSLCPEIQGPCEHAEVGCVAMSMGQIMHYWGYPASGWGSRSYLNSNETLFADFGNTTYGWANMPDSLGDNSSEAEIEAVATLLYHCGIAVKMSYRIYGSSANSADIPDALVRYFNYSKRIHREKKTNYSSEEWSTLLKECLDMQRPVQYSGFGSSGGHSFVCDGYDENGMFHFNWGWGGPANGYFTLDNLNPNGYILNNNQNAIFDIIPQYEPYVVEAKPFPSGSCTVQGNGEYHRGDTCTLTAVPAENAKFLYWKQNGGIVSRVMSYSFEVLCDVEDIDAFFSLFEVRDISASYSPDPNDPNGPNVSLSWNTHDIEWSLLNKFEINGQNGAGTDGEYIYTYNRLADAPQDSIFGKYTMDGDLIEFFGIPGAKPAGMAWDGNYIYCSHNSNAFYLYKYDFVNKTLVDSTNMNESFANCFYDAENDGFWLQTTYTSQKIVLQNRQGENLDYGPSFNINNYFPSGFGKLISTDGTPYLLIVSSQGKIKGYDIQNHILNDYNPNIPDLFNRHIDRAFLGKYEGKDAMFFVCDIFYPNTSYCISIYEISKNLSQTTGYRLYRSNDQGEMVMFADALTDTSYIDDEWNSLLKGTYKYGISMVYANGNESEIIWSDPIVKGDYGVLEGNGTAESPSVQKVIEDGKVIIIKDGIRYNISGQRLN